jgi:hypothetical protein
MSEFKKWTVRQFARHYVKTIDQIPNENGDYISPIFGSSHLIVFAADLKFGKVKVKREIKKEIDRIERKKLDANIKAFSDHRPDVNLP